MKNGVRFLSTNSSFLRPQGFSLWPLFGGMAQLEAHLLCKQSVAGSSPATSTTHLNKLKEHCFECNYKNIGVNGLKMKRVLAAALAAIMCLCLASCKREKVPTAEELLANGGLDSGQGVDADIKLLFEADLSMAALMGEGNDGTMHMGISADMNLVNDGTTTAHTAGTVGVQMLGMDYSEDMESYTLTKVNGSKTTYTKDSDSGEWTYTTDSEDDGVGGLLALDQTLFTDLKVAPVEKGDTVYTVTGRIKVADVMDSSEMGADSILDLAGGDGSISEDMAFDVTMLYGREAQKLQRVSMVLDTESGSAEGMEITTFSLEVIVNSTGDMMVVIPNDVIENARPDEF